MSSRPSDQEERIAWKNHDPSDDIATSMCKGEGEGMIEVAIRDELVQIRLLLELILQAIDLGSQPCRRAA
jgi:hypothetical protein